MGWLTSFFEQHHEEVPLNGIPTTFEIDHDYYKALDHSGRAYFLGAQNMLCELVGYMMFSIHGHPHYKSLRFASSEAFWVNPKHRGKDGLSIIRQMTHRAELDLKFMHNVDIMSVRVNPIKDVSKIFSRMGYNESCIYMSKKL